MINVSMDAKPHPSHAFGLWEPGIVSTPNSDRFGKERECECGARDIIAGGAGSRWFDGGAEDWCELARDRELMEKDGGR